MNSLDTFDNQGKQFEMPSIIHLNVGGTMFSTSVHTLTQRDPSSMLAIMFSGRHPLHMDVKNGAAFIDRDGTHFRHILNWLRNGELPKLDNILAYQELLCEAKYYQLIDLAENITLMCKNLEEEDKLKPDMSRKDVVKGLFHFRKETLLRLRGLNLTGQNLSKLYLSGVDFSHSNLNNTIFSGAELQHSDFTASEANGASFDNANLKHATLNDACLMNARFCNAHLQCADLRKANCFNADFTGAFLPGALLMGADLSFAELENADLSGANLSNAKLNSAKLKGTKLFHANLENADFSGADLSNANLEMANLQGIKLRGSNLRGMSRRIR